MRIARWIKNQNTLFSATAGVSDGALFGTAGIARTPTSTLEPLISLAEHERA